MRHQDLTAKAYEELITAKLQQAKAELERLEATARERKAQAEIHALNALKVKRDEIETRLREFITASKDGASQIKAELERRVAGFEKEMASLADKMKGHAAHR